MLRLKHSTNCKACSQQELCAASAVRLAKVLGRLEVSQ